MLCNWPSSLLTIMCKQKYSKDFVQKKISSKSKHLNHLKKIQMNSQIKEVLLMEVKQKKTTLNRQLNKKVKFKE